MQSYRVAGIYVVASTGLGLLTVPTRADGPPPTSATPAPITAPGEPTSSASLRKVELGAAPPTEGPWTNVAGSCEHYLYASPCPDSGNTVIVPFAFSPNPGRVRFTRSPECGSVSPTYMDPTPCGSAYCVHTTYTPCETEGTTVTITADPTTPGMANKTSTVCLLPRVDICTGQTDETCVATFQAGTGCPVSAPVGVTVNPPSCGTVLPTSGTSQNICTRPCGSCWFGTSSQGNCPLTRERNGNCDCGCQFTDEWDCGCQPGERVAYVFCSEYTAGACQETQVCVRFMIDNPAPYADSRYYKSYDQTRPPPCCAGGYCCGDCEYISRVTAGSIDKSSGCSNGYADYTHLSTDMQRGVGYPITVTISNYYTVDRLGLWVDWNQDEDFSDAGETIKSCGTCSASGECTATITPSATAPFGSTRMRVRIQDTSPDYGDPCPAQSCGNTAYGEVEDYTIVVGGCTPAPTPNSPIVNFCPPKTLSCGGTPPSGVIWYWQGTTCGTRTDLGSCPTPYVPSGSGRYYIRARSTNDPNCWSGSCAYKDVTIGDPCLSSCTAPGINDADCAGCCSETLDNCTAPEPNGSPCNDDLYCNWSDTCNSSGSCANHGTNPCLASCTPPGVNDADCVGCCSEALDNCTAPEPNDSPCDDGLFCNGADACSGGACSSHVGDPCADCGEYCEEQQGACAPVDAIESSVPPNCAIDARQPHAPGDPGALQGWNSVALTFDAACNVSDVTPDDFTVSCNPVGPPCPLITGVTPVGQTVTVQLSSVIPAGKWTCITHTASTEQVCIGSLPADVNSDLTALPGDPEDPRDIFALIDCLNGVGACQIWQCDCDRSILCAPADILCVIDLLNGANDFLVWNGKSLAAACPSAP